ncbi:MAG: T9SS type A sorting domain-containing protein [bacterium]|nr:T9SS type A sorting domain-containing protein [bacterium]
MIMLTLSGALRRVLVADKRRDLTLNHPTPLVSGHTLRARPDTTRVLALTALLLFAALTSLPAHAQWSTDPHQNTVISYGASSPKMVSDGNGGAIIAWWDFSYHALYVQRLDRYGYAFWGEGGIHVYGDGGFEYEDFDLCEDGAGGCVLAFIDMHEVSYPVFNYQVHAQRLDSLGNFRWGDNGPRICSSDSNVSHPSVEPDGLGGYFIIWEDTRLADYNQIVYGQHLSAMGYTTWSDDGIPMGGPCHDSSCHSALYASLPGYAFAIWQIYIEDNWGQRIDIDGNLHWGGMGADLPDDIGDWNTFISDDVGGCIAAGTRSLWGGGFANYAQRFDSLANPMWGDSAICFSVECNHNSFTRRLVRNQTGTYAAWSDDHTTPTQGYIEKFDDNGNLLWGLQGHSITANDSNPSYEPYIATTNSDELVMGYFYTTPTVRGQRAQKWDSDGNSLWEQGAVILTYSDMGPLSSKVISDMAGGGIFSWTDGILYAQQISSNGNLGEVLAVQPDKSRPNPTEITLLNCFPNPFNESAIITLDLPTHNPKQPYQIDIYDTAGRVVRRLEAGSLPAGVNYLPWDGRNEQNSSVPSGVYFLNVYGAGKSNPTFIVKVK